MTNPGEAHEKWVPELTSFGARLALVRHRMGWNIKEAAAACGLPAQSWRGWELDGREPHRLVTIAMTISTIAGVDLDWLVYGPDRALRPVVSSQNLGGGEGTQLYVPEDFMAPHLFVPGERVLAVIGAHRPADGSSSARPLDHTRAVHQTRPTGAGSVRAAPAMGR